MHLQPMYTFGVVYFLSFLSVTHECGSSTTISRRATGGLLCQYCTESLVPATCPFKTGCSDCVETKINFATNATTQCRTATITCAASSGNMYIGLTRQNATPIEVMQQNIGSLACTDSGWEYTATDGTVSIINGISCYNFPTSLQMSPIDIRAADVIFDPMLVAEMLNFNYVVGDVKEMTLTPDLYGFQVYMQDNAQSTLTATHLPATFRLYNVHAHWNDGSRVFGSEHLLNGMKYSGEIHYVHWNPRYGTFQNSVGKPDGLAVLGVFFEIGAENTEFSKITNAISSRLPLTAKTTVPKNELQNIDFKKIIPTDQHYYTYTGSLTTPNYNTCVLWTVFRTPITLSQAQKDVLLQLFAGKNVRDAQEVLSVIRSSFNPQNVIQSG